jgi:type I restriction enzyme S subunit
VDELMTLCDQLEAAQKEGEFQRDELRAASLNRLTTTDDGARTDSDVRFFLNSSPRLITEPEHVLALRQAIYDLAVTGRLVTMNPSDEPVEGLSAHPSVDMSEQGSAAGVGALPVGWRNVTLGDITTLITSGSRGWAQYYADHGAIFVRSQNVKYGSLSTTDLAHVLPPASSEGRRTQVSVGDLLVVITGDVGHVGVWDTDLGEAYISQHVALVRPNSPELSPWLRLCLIAPSAGRQQLLSSIYGGKPGLNLKQVRMVWLPLAPLLEQQRIVARVDDLMVLCDHMESALASAQDERGRLLEALLREALNDARRNCYFGDAKFLEPAQQSMQ